MTATSPPPDLPTNLKIRNPVDLGAVSEANKIIYTESKFVKLGRFTLYKDQGVAHAAPIDNPALNDSIEFDTVAHAPGEREHVRTLVRLFFLCRALTRAKLTLEKA